MNSQNVVQPHAHVGSTILATQLSHTAAIVFVKQGVPELERSLGLGESPKRKRQLSAALAHVYKEHCLIK